MLQRVAERSADRGPPWEVGKESYTLEPACLCVCFTGLCNYLNVCPCMYFLEFHSAFMISGLVCSCMVDVCLDLYMGLVCQGINVDSLQVCVLNLKQLWEGWSRSSPVSLFILLVNTVNTPGQSKR